MEAVIVAGAGVQERRLKADPVFCKAVRYRLQPLVYGVLALLVGVNHALRQKLTAV